MLRLVDKSVEINPLWKIDDESNFAWVCPSQVILKKHLKNINVQGKAQNGHINHVFLKRN